MIPFLLVWYYSYLRYPQFYIAAFMITLSVQANHTIMKPNHIHVTPLSFILPSSQVHQKYTCTSQAHALRRYTTTPLPPLHNTATPLRQLSTHPPTTSCTQRKTEKKSLCLATAHLTIPDPWRNAVASQPCSIPGTAKSTVVPNCGDRGL
jgi:hypothetical protein